MQPMNSAISLLLTNSFKALRPLVVGCSPTLSVPTDIPSFAGSSHGHSFRLVSSTPVLLSITPPVGSLTTSLLFFPFRAFKLIEQFSSAVILNLREYLGFKVGVGLYLASAVIALPLIFDVFRSMRFHRPEPHDTYLKALSNAIRCTIVDCRNHSTVAWLMILQILAFSLTSLSE
jgi:hypothetical protein